MSHPRNSPAKLQGNIPSLLEAVRNHPSGLRALVRRARSDLDSWLPCLFHEAGHGAPKASASALKTLLELVREAEDASLLLRIFRMLPEQSSILAGVSLLVTERLLAMLPEVERLEGPDAAMLWNNLAVRAREANQAQRALELAEQALRVSASFSDARPEARRVQVICLLNVASERAQHGRNEAALTAASQARRLAAEVARSGRAEDKINEARTLTSCANRLAALGQYESAIREAETATVILRGLPAPAEGKHDLAIAELAIANCLMDLGLHQQARPRADRADRLFRALSGHEPDQYLEFTVAAATAYARCLSHCDNLERAYRLLGSTVERIEALMQRQPERFGRDCVAVLINLADVAGDLGRFEESIIGAERALRVVRRLGRRLNQRDYYLEGVAYASLFNSLFRMRLFPRASRAAMRAVECFGRLPQTHPKAAEEQARALRNLAEARRTLCKPGRASTAITAAREAVELAQRTTVSDNPSGLLLEANCRTTLATCLEEHGRIEDAIIEEEASLRIRRRLCRRSPRVYRTSLAYSFRHLAQLQLRAGRAEEARASAQKAVIHTEAKGAADSERTAALLADSLRVLAEAELAGGNPELALQALERAIALLRPRYHASPAVWLPSLLPLCTRYVETCSEHNREFRTDLVEDVILHGMQELGGLRPAHACGAGNA